jgi:hypothetical protein
LPILGGGNAAALFTALRRRGDPSANSNLRNLPVKIFCTVVTASYLKFAHALADSLRQAGNPEPLHVLVVDGTSPGPRDDGGIVAWRLDDLPPEFPVLMRYYFDAFELCNALKPFFVSHLFRSVGAVEVTYLDSDIYVTGSFSRVRQEAPTASLLVTPHFLGPPPLEPHYSKETDVVDLGVYNGGFALWRAGAAAERMLDWMKQRFPSYGFCDPLRRMYVDQKLLPLVAIYFPADVAVLRSPGLNVAYWNAHERPVRLDDDRRWYIDGEEVVFFHLSGFRVAAPAQACAYLGADANAAILRRSPWLSGVLAAYADQLTRAPNGESTAPYPFNTYRGIRLNPRFRQLLFAQGDLQRKSIAYWRIWVWHRLRMLKRLVTGVRPLN